MAENQDYLPDQDTHSTETQPSRVLSPQQKPTAKGGTSSPSSTPVLDSCLDTSSKKTKRTSSPKSKTKPTTPDARESDSSTPESDSQQQSPPQLKPPALIVGIDYGASVIKVIYQKVGTDVVHFMSIEPYVTPTSCALIKDCVTSDVDSVDFADSAWVGIAEQYYVVGDLARTDFHADPNLEHFKYDKAVPSTLAALWLISRKLKLKPNFSVALCLLLPPDEYKVKERFESYLREALASYITPSGEMNVSLALFDCKAEGSGIYFLHRNKIGDTLKTKLCAIICLGYRNASILVADRGRVRSREAKSSLLGMHLMLELINDRIPRVPTEKLLPAIIEADDSTAQKHFEHLARSKDPKYRADEIRDIATAVRQAHEKYLTILTNWLDENLPVDVEEIVFSGGTADYLLPDLKKHYGNKAIWNANASVPSEIDDAGLGNRILDILGLFVNFRATVPGGVKSSRSTKKPQPQEQSPSITKPDTKALEVDS